MLKRWYEDPAKKSKYAPKHKIPGHKHHMTKNGMFELFRHRDNVIERDKQLELQFKTFFPFLTKDNWKKELDKQIFEQEEMPYQLKV